MTYKPMSDQDIIDMARQAGFTVGKDSAGEYVAPKYEDSIGTLVRFAALVGYRVFEVEQEQCAAKVVAEGVAEYERGLKDGALLEKSKKCECIFCTEVFVRCGKEICRQCGKEKA